MSCTFESRFVLKLRGAELSPVTSTYLEGEAKGNAMAKRGHSRDRRPDSKQVCIGLVVSKEEVPLGYDVFDGDRIDVTTLEEIVEIMEAQYCKAQRTWAMDRDMASEANLEWLREGDRKYQSARPRASPGEEERRSAPAPPGGEGDLPLGRRCGA